MKYGHKASRPLAAVLLFVLHSGAALAAQTSGTELGSPATSRIDTNDPALRRVASRLQCQCGGCTASVLTCPHQMDCGLRMYILNTVRNGLAAGKSEEQIVTEVAQEYGPKILLEPPREGFGLLGWLMPFMALLAGAGAVGFVLWRWMSSAAIEETPPAAPQAEAAEPPSAVPAEVVEKYRAQIDRELEQDR